MIDRSSSTITAFPREADVGAEVRANGKDAGTVAVGRTDGAGASGAGGVARAVAGSARVTRRAAEIDR